MRPAETIEEQRERLLKECPELTDNWLRAKIRLHELVRYIHEKRRKGILESGKRMIHEGLDTEMVFSVIEFMLSDNREYAEADDCAMICPRCNDSLEKCYVCEDTGVITRWFDVA